MNAQDASEEMREPDSTSLEESLYFSARSKDFERTLQ